MIAKVLCVAALVIAAACPPFVALAFAVLAFAVGHLAALFAVAELGGVACLAWLIAVRVAEGRTASRAALP